MTKTPYDQDLDRNAANFAPLTPLGRSETDKVTWPAYPLTDEIETVYAICARGSDRLDHQAEATTSRTSRTSIPSRPGPDSSA